MLLVVSLTVIGKVVVDALQDNNEGKITVNKTATKEIGEENNEVFGRKANVTLSVTGNEFTTSSSLDVVLVLDRSSSMHKNGSSKLSDAKSAAIELVNNLFANNTEDRTVVQMGVVTFGKTVIDKWSNSTLSSNKNDITNKINAITSDDSDIPGNTNGQGTNIQSGLAKANELLKNSTAKNKVVILLTDGEPTLFDYEGETFGTSNSDSEVCIEYSETETEKVCSFGECEDQPKCITKKKPSDAAKTEANILKNDENKVTIYSVGFGLKDNRYDSNDTKQSKKNAREFLQAVATKTESPYYLLAENKDELTKSFSDIVSSITSIAKDVVVTDTVPAGFSLDKEGLKNTYGDKVSTTENADGTTTITWNIGELKVTEDPTLTYQVTAKEDYYGGMYTNVTAVLTGTATEGNPAYPDGKIMETFPMPEVAIPMVTEDDSYTAKLGEILTIAKENGILKNDSKTKLTDGDNTTVTDEIIIKNTSCGNISDITVNADGSFTYQPNSTCYGKNNNKVTFDYEVKSTVTINGVPTTVISNTSTITLDLTKDNSGVKDPEVTKINDNGSTTNNLTEAFNYTIEYHTTVENHVGNATVTITDTLPYELDTTKNNILDGGIYNPETKTITWIVPINNINTYEQQNHMINIVKHISVFYKDIPTDVETIENKVSVITNIDTTPVETTQETKVSRGNLIVEYVDNLGNSLLDTITSNGLVESLYTTSANNIEIINNVEYVLIATKVNGEKLEEKTNNYSSVYVEGTTTVTYVYYKNTGKIIPEDTSIEKEGTNKVTSTEGEFIYTITYNSKIENYIGNANVTIVDNLPSAIDESKSILDGGTYNATNNTITWEIPYTGIDTSKTGAYPIEIVKNIKVVFTDLNAADRTVTNEVVGTIATSKSTDEQYDQKVTALEVKGTVIAKYVDTNNNELTTSITTTDLVGNDYTTVEKTIDGYKFIRVDGEKIGKYIEGTITVTYVYYKVEGNIDPTKNTITKTGTDKVTTVESPFDYTITYNTTISDYIGDATVTITDTLPYEIDLKKSNLNGGDYDKTTKTITWTEEVTNIDTNANGDKTIIITKNIQVVYIGLEPTTRVVTNKVIGKVQTSLSEKETTPATKDTAVEVSGTVTAHYITTTGDILTNPVTTTQLVGNVYTTEEKQFDNYELVEVKGERVGKYTVEPIEVTYIYYKETGEITQNTIEKTGTEAITSKDTKFNYTIQYKTEINQYIGNATVTIIDKLPQKIDVTTSDLAGGTYDEESLTITWILTYKNINTHVNGIYKIEETKNLILVYEDLDITVDEITNEVTATVKTDISENTKEDDATTEINVMGTVTAIYIDEEGNELIVPVTQTGKVGTNYATEEKQFDSYELILINGEETGEYVEGEITVTYIYAKLGKGGDVEVLPPQTGVETTDNMSFNLFTVLFAGILILVKKII